MYYGSYVVEQLGERDAVLIVDDDRSCPTQISRHQRHCSAGSISPGKTFYDPLANAFVDAMQRALPECSRDQIIWEYEYALGALLMTIADRRVERLSRHGAKSGDPSQGGPLIDFLSAGFVAMNRRRAASDRRASATRS
ncbi:hypothetical protein [Paraburkholderia sp. BL23I1N1]|uniref:hypothetical protein n=1 Tax=Paraburkholderia sp. BL23I1N1 TaxID=1938802 RepID=UPI0038F5EF60